MALALCALYKENMNTQDKRQQDKLSETGRAWSSLSLMFLGHAQRAPSAEAVIRLEMLLLMFFFMLHKQIEDKASQKKSNLKNLNQKI